MNRINTRGLELIEYKLELKKDYPELVLKSLITTLEQMVENKILDIDTYYNIKDESFGMENFEEYLLTKKDFTKTEEEIFEEFEVIRKELDKKLKEHETLENLITESVITKDLILVTRKFCINEQFTIDYFGVEEKDLLKLMKRKGFVEKFAVLRLTSIFNDFMKNLSYPEELFKCDSSLVYFDKEENGYSIDFSFNLKIEDVENEEKVNEICEKIKDLKKQVEDFYMQKTIC